MHIHMEGDPLAVGVLVVGHCGLLSQPVDVAFRDHLSLKSQESHTKSQCGEPVPAISNTEHKF